MSTEDATARSKAAFESVFENGTKIELDHYLVYFSRESYTLSRTHTCLLCSSPLHARGRPADIHFLWYVLDFEYGRLLARCGEKDRAREQLELVLSGKHLEVNASGRKGKYSLEVRSSFYLHFILHIKRRRVECVAFAHSRGARSTRARSSCVERGTKESSSISIMEWNTNTYL